MARENLPEILEAGVADADGAPDSSEVPTVDSNGLLGEGVAAPYNDSEIQIPDSERESAEKSESSNVLLEMQELLHAHYAETKRLIHEGKITSLDQVRARSKSHDDEVEKRFGTSATPSRSRVSETAEAKSTSIPGDALDAGTAIAVPDGQEPPAHDESNASSGAQNGNEAIVSTMSEKPATNVLPTGEQPTAATQFTESSNVTIPANGTGAQNKQATVNSDASGNQQVAQSSEQANSVEVQPPSKQPAEANSGNGQATPQSENTGSPGRAPKSERKRDNTSSLQAAYDKIVVENPAVPTDQIDVALQLLEVPARGNEPPKMSLRKLKQSEVALEALEVSGEPGDDDLYEHYKDPVTGEDVTEKARKAIQLLSHEMNRRGLSPLIGVEVPPATAPSATIAETKSNGDPAVTATAEQDQQAASDNRAYKERGGRRSNSKRKNGSSTPAPELGGITLLDEDIEARIIAEQQKEHRQRQLESLRVLVAAKVASDSVGTTSQTDPDANGLTSSRPRNYSGQVGGVRTIAKGLGKLPVKNGEAVSQSPSAPENEVTQQSGGSDPRVGQVGTALGRTNRRTSLFAPRQNAGPKYASYLAPETQPPAPEIPPSSPDTSTTSIPLAGDPNVQVPTPDTPPATQNTLPPTPNTLPPTPNSLPPSPTPRRLVAVFPEPQFTPRSTLGTTPDRTPVPDALAGDPRLAVAAMMTGAAMKEALRDRKESLAERAGSLSDHKETLRGRVERLKERAVELGQKAMAHTIAIGETTFRQNTGNIKNGVPERKLNLARAGLGVVAVAAIAFVTTKGYSTGGLFRGSVEAAVNSTPGTGGSGNAAAAGLEQIQAPAAPSSVPQIPTEAAPSIPRPSLAEQYHEVLGSYNSKTGEGTVSHVVTNYADQHGIHLNHRQLNAVTQYAVDYDKQAHMNRGLPTYAPTAMPRGYDVYLPSPQEFDLRIHEIIEQAEQANSKSK